MAASALVAGDRAGAGPTAGGGDRGAWQPERSSGGGDRGGREWSARRCRGDRGNRADARSRTQPQPQAQPQPQPRRSSPAARRLRSGTRPARQSRQRRRRRATAGRRSATPARTIAATALPAAERRSPGQNDQARGRSVAPARSRVGTIGAGNRPRPATASAAATIAAARLEPWRRPTTADGGYRGGCSNGYNRGGQLEPRLARRQPLRLEQLPRVEPQRLPPAALLRAVRLELRLSPLRDRLHAQHRCCSARITGSTIPYDYRLPEAYGPYRWVRYYNDALLVDIYTGEVVDTVYDIFW